MKKLNILIFCQMYRSKGISCRLLTAEECLDLCPFLEISDLEGGILIPDDCIADSKSVCNTYRSVKISLIKPPKRLRCGP